MEKNLKEKRIWSRIKEDYDSLVADGREVVGVFLFGSQNYCCDTEESDIDTKAVVIPTLTDMIMGTTKITTTYVRSDGELTVFDINSFHNSIKKQNINFLEILFTKWYYINPRYTDLYEVLRNEREKIAHYNEYAAVECINGVFVNKLKKIFHPVVSNKNRINKYGYDNKALSDCIRLSVFLKKYIEGYSYEDCLVDNEILDEVLRIKTDGSVLSPIQARQYMNSIQTSVDKLYYDYVNKNESSTNCSTLSLINKVTIDCCKAHIVDTLGV